MNNACLKINVDLSVIPTLPPSLYNRIQQHTFLKCLTCPTLHIVLNTALESHTSMLCVAQEVNNPFVPCLHLCMLPSCCCLLATLDSAMKTFLCSPKFHAATEKSRSTHPKEKGRVLHFLIFTVYLPDAECTFSENKGFHFVDASHHEISSDTL